MRHPAPLRIPWSFGVAGSGRISLPSMNDLRDTKHSLAACWWEVESQQQLNLDNQLGYLSAIPPIITAHTRRPIPDDRFQSIPAVPCCKSISICACADNASARSSVINALHRGSFFPIKSSSIHYIQSGVSTRIRAPQASADVKSRTHPGARSRILRTHPLRVLHEAQMSLSLKQPGSVPRVMMLLE